MKNIFKKILFLLLVSLTISFSSFAEAPCQMCQSEEKLCGGVPYVPQLQCDCAGVNYDLCSPDGKTFQQCCEGLYICPCNEGDLLCGGNQCYNPKISGCCGGNVPYSKEWQGCCEGDTFFLAYETCCDGEIVTKDSCCSNEIINPDKQGCCNGVIYDLSTQACCEGKIVPGIPRVLVKPTGGDKCCKKHPVCFFATVDDCPEAYLVVPCDSTALVTFPTAICPNSVVQIHQLGRCGEEVNITGDAKNGFKLEGVCPW